MIHSHSNHCCGINFITIRIVYEIHNSSYVWGFISTSTNRFNKQPTLYFESYLIIFFSNCCVFLYYMWNLSSISKQVWQCAFNHSIRKKQLWVGSQPGLQSESQVYTKNLVFKWGGRWREEAEVEEEEEEEEKQQTGFRLHPSMVLHWPSPGVCLSSVTYPCT